ncbi:MAG: transcriptional repressor LexA [Chloroflexi bacterium]|nr:transcriptional repressor LexA [Chloroflexota bacterium]MBU1746769.1 transcriptional repressor LexA [Chloroflexota bacterium]MBU1878619.1 transcriptional repressor LexA [Chloroflexota bacterium]
MKPTKLSERQRQILDFIQRFVTANGYPPTIRQIGEAVAITSTSVVDYNLKALERMGAIRRDREVSRGIELLIGTVRDNIVRVPILGRIAAGEPIPVPEENGAYVDEDEVLELTRDILRGYGDELYALRVRGTSMIDALVNDGDIVIMRQQRMVENGEMAAVWLREERETTLKRFYREGTMVRLQPANPLMEPLRVPARNVEIQGKVVAVVRQT